MHILYVLYFSLFRTVQRMRWTEINVVRSVTCSSHLPSWLSRTTRAKRMLREFAWCWESHQVCPHPQVRYAKLNGYVFLFFITSYKPAKINLFFIKYFFCSFSTFTDSRVHTLYSSGLDTLMCAQTVMNQSCRNTATGSCMKPRV